MTESDRGNVFSFPDLRPEEVVDRVHELAAKASNIYWTAHALTRMEERDITTRQVLSTLRLGRAVDPPRFDQDGDCEVVLVRRSAGTAVRVAVAISWNQLYVITAMRD